MTPENAVGRACDAAEAMDEARRESSDARFIGDGHGAPARRFGRGPRRAARGSKLERLEAIARLDHDPGFSALAENDRRILRIAVTSFGDARLTWFAKLATWAADAGVSRATVGRTVKRAREAGVLEVTPHLRPPGASRQGQTSSTYRLILNATNKASHPNKASHGETPDKASHRNKASHVDAQARIATRPNVNKASHETPEPDFTRQGEVSTNLSREWLILGPDSTILAVVESQDAARERASFEPTAVGIESRLGVERL